MDSELHDEAVATAAEAARAAGEILRSRFGLGQRIRFKGDRDLVTDADQAAETAIVHIIRKGFPGHRILAEEGSVGGDDPDALWIVDPLDGTTSFAHGYPMFAVSIALEVRGVVEVGVVYQPILDELFTAVRGKGARLNAKRIRVSRTDRLGASLLCSGFPYEQDEIEAALPLFANVVRRARGIRRDGTAALDLCYVAMGRFDGFWERTLRPWDVAAGGLILAEAGGRLSDYVGRPFDIRGGEVAATNGRIHAELLEALNPSVARRADSVI